MATTIELTPEQMQEIVDEVLKELFSEDDENLAPFDENVQMPTTADEIAAYDVAVWKKDADGHVTGSGHMGLKQAFDTYAGDKKTELDQYVKTLEDTLDSYVGADGTSGLKKELSDLANTLETALDSKVNDESTGLIKQMDDHATSLETAFSQQAQDAESSLSQLSTTLENDLNDLVNDPDTGYKKQLQEYVDQTGDNAAAAASSASAAQSAQQAAEDARDMAQTIVGGDYIYVISVDYPPVYEDEDASGEEETT